MQAHSKATEERQTASEADQAVREASNIATTELEQRLRSRRIVESELQELRVEQQRGAAVLEQRSAERNELAVRLEALSVELSQARQKRERAHEATQEHEQLVATLQQQLSHAQANLLALEARQSKRQVERAAQQALRERIGAEIGTTRDSLAVTHQQLDQLDQQASELGEREAQLIEELQATLLALAPIEQELSGAELQRMELQATRRTEETRLAELRTTERLAREDREERHVQAQRTADELERLHAEIDETAELEQDTGGGGAQWAEQLRLGLSTNDAEPPEPIDLEPLRRRITTLQRELRAVGGVAESVVDEFRELSERHDFLNNQSDDLRVAMIELHQAAAELEAHMRERFSAVFEATQEAFQECFGQLFGGGEARLVLTEPDDLLRTGVDIVARPPGKKLQGLLSLSGGERALTIVALLFGLLRVNPTPFCVLDEVDAALDEANVQRFANLLADFARAIQFVVVTHNRATMDRADALYGVSMDADGISRIFSIKPSALVNGGDSAQASNADRRPPTAGPRP
jgi:chromosome segregation protein